MISNDFKYALQVQCRAKRSALFTCRVIFKYIIVEINLKMWGLELKYIAPKLNGPRLNGQPILTAKMWLDKCWPFKRGALYRGFRKYGQVPDSEILYLIFGNNEHFGNPQIEIFH